VPVLWESVSAATQQEPIFRRIESWAQSGTAVIEPAIEGPSFGLTFALILVSHVFNISLPTDVASSAALDPDGVIQDVGGIEIKVAGLLQLAPRVTRFLVSANQQKDAEAVAGDDLQIIGVRTLGEALRIVFGTGLEDALVAAGNDPEKRPALIRSFLRLSLASREAAIDWKPIERAAVSARNGWAAMDEAETFSLEFTAAVAARHDRNGGDLSVPPDVWLNAQPLPVRAQVAAHLVQQSADVGHPSADVAEQWVARYANTEPREAFPHQLRLLGAQARLWAVTGQPQEALRRQEAIAQAWWAAFDGASTSFPLTEWFRLSGACGNEASFDRADALHKELLRSAALTGHSPRYIELARAKAGLELDTVPQDHLEQAFAGLRSPLVPDHLRWSATRWLLRLYGDAGRHDHAAKLWDELVASDQNDAKTQRFLAILDNPREASVHDRTLAELRRANPGPMHHLLEAVGRLQRDPADYISRFFPY
jgi:hypothetical protein